MFLGVKQAMNICIKTILSKSDFVKAFAKRHPKIMEWIWFFALWLGGLLTVTVLTYPIKMLINTLK